MTALLDDIARLGFNAIRLPLAADNVLSNPVVGRWSLTADEALRGMRSLDLVERLVSTHPPLSGHGRTLGCRDPPPMNRTSAGSGLSLPLLPTVCCPWAYHRCRSCSQVVEASARGLLILLDMHRLRAQVWPDPRGLWYEQDEDPSAPRLRSAWRVLARRFCSHWNVVGADLFNEPWGGTWGDGRVETGWAVAAKSIGDEVRAGKGARTVGAKMLAF